MTRAVVALSLSAAAAAISCAGSMRGAASSSSERLLHEPASPLAQTTGECAMLFLRSECAARRAVVWSRLCLSVRVSAAEHTTGNHLPACLPSRRLQLKTTTRLIPTTSLRR